MKLDQNTKRWMELPAYQDLMRQVHVDIYVGLKNGVPAKDCKKALLQLANVIKNSVKWDPTIPRPPQRFVTKVISCPKCKGTGQVQLPPAYPRFHTAWKDCPDCYGEGRVATTA